MYYLSDANYQTDNPSHTNNPSLDSRHFCYKRISRPGLELGVRVSAFAFSQDYFCRPMFTLDALRVLYSRKKIITFRVVENRCLQCIESIFVNLPQFAKSCLKESLNRFFWHFSLHLFGYFGLSVESFCFCECLFHCSTFDGGAIETYGWKTASTGFTEVHSSP